LNNDGKNGQNKGIHRHEPTVIESAAAIAPYDFEDSVQYMSALPYHPDVIITRDKKGFKDFDILVMTPAEFVMKAKE
jgi:hypothetical protein